MYSPVLESHRSGDQAAECVRNSDGANSTIRLSESKAFAKTQEVPAPVFQVAY